MNNEYKEIYFRSPGYFRFDSSYNNYIQKFQNGDLYIQEWENNKYL